MLAAKKQTGFFTFKYPILFYQDSHMARRIFTNLLYDMMKDVLKLLE